MLKRGNFGYWLTEALSGGHWVTIKSAMGVTHLYLSNGDTANGIPAGTVMAGPKGLIGANIAHLPNTGDFTHDHHLPGYTPAGAGFPDDYAEQFSNTHAPIPLSKTASVEAFNKAHGAVEKGNQITGPAKPVKVAKMAAPSGMGTTLFGADKISDEARTAYKLAKAKNDQQGMLKIVKDVIRDLKALGAENEAFGWEHSLDNLQGEVDTQILSGDTQHVSGLKIEDMHRIVSASQTMGDKNLTVGLTRQLIDAMALDPANDAKTVAAMRVVLGEMEKDAAVWHQDPRNQALIENLNRLIDKDTAYYDYNVGGTYERIRTEVLGQNGLTAAAHEAMNYRLVTLADMTKVGNTMNPYLRKDILDALTKVNDPWGPGADGVGEGYYYNARQAVKNEVLVATKLQGQGMTDAIAKANLAQGDESDQFERFVRNNLMAAIRSDHVEDAAGVDARLADLGKLVKAMQADEIAEDTAQSLLDYLTRVDQKDYSSAKFADVLVKELAEAQKNVVTAAVAFKPGVGSAMIHPTVTKATKHMRDRMMKENPITGDGKEMSDTDSKAEIAHNLGARFVTAGVTRDQAHAIYSNLQVHSTGSSSDWREKLASGIVHQWSQSSSDSLRGSIAIQYAAQKLFGVSSVDWRNREISNEGDAHDRAMALVDDPVLGPILLKCVKEYYNETQALFKAQGVTHVTLYRGVKDMPCPKLYEAVENAQAPVGLVMQPGEMTQNPLTSWSVNYKTAVTFSGEQVMDGDHDTTPDSMGIVLASTVPVEDVFSTWRSGQGCQDEQEMVLIGRDRPMVASNATDLDDWIAFMRKMDNKGYQPREDAVTKESAPKRPAGNTNMDWPQGNADWIKQRWTLTGTPSEQAQSIIKTNGPDPQKNLAHFMTLPVARAMPESVKKALLSLGYRI